MNKIEYEDQTIFFNEDLSDQDKIGLMVLYGVIDTNTADFLTEEAEKKDNPGLGKLIQTIVGVFR